MKSWGFQKKGGIALLLMSLMGCVNTENIKENIEVIADADAISEYRKAAEQGDAEAQFNLGAFYAAPRDLTKAAYWYRKAAEQGDAESQFVLAGMYKRGKGAPRNSAKYIYWIRKAAEYGSPRAQSVLSTSGDIAYDHDRRDYWRQKAFDQRRNSVWVELTMVREKYLRSLAKTDYERINEYRKAAEKGDATAQFILGVFYGTPRNSAKAAQWYHKAAEQGDVKSQVVLAEMYFMGKDIRRRDSAKAAHWYRKAAEQGDTSSQYLLGLFYGLGRGVPYDPDKQIYWYRKAAKQGNHEAQKGLRNMLGIHLPPFVKPTRARTYIGALQKGEFLSAIGQLIFPTDLPTGKIMLEMTALAKKVEKINEALGHVSISDQAILPVGEYSVYFVSMIPLQKHPSVSTGVLVPITFSKAGKGVLKFKIGKIDGKQGTFEVEYWCFTCEDSLEGRGVRVPVSFENDQ